ncbi:MAG: hypothetical protein A2010_10640 [Nitrospirae bacterium GWD2_57_9]|nr:MAG: hypothetical protein A2010_10640 [Nitrospirae bacterium GWD2_57_9]OGW45325.1 MAG: hypothetical protein A2078_01980 [Nitrospirae bacterium GWC2_57_9]
MSELLDELKREHALMLDILDDVKRLGLSSRAGQEKFLSAKALLLSHMQKEDREFYPGLRKAAESSEDLKRTLDYFAGDMEVVSRKAKQVFDKHSSEAAGTEPSDVTLLYMILRDRIRAEEQVLFKRFERLDRLPDRKAP